MSTSKHIALVALSLAAAAWSLPVAAETETAVIRLAQLETAPPPAPAARAAPVAVPAIKSAAAPRRHKSAAYRVAVRDPRPPIRHCVSLGCSGYLVLGIAY